jgi:hypothetical protein
MQTLRIAVVKNDPKLDPNRGVAPAALSKADWKSLFDPDLRTDPADIYPGQDIVLWHSTDVHREVILLTGGAGTQPYLSQPKGTVFIHGMFFPHDAEKSGLTVGTTTPEHRPRTETHPSKKSWFRPSN